MKEAERKGREKRKNVEKLSGKQSNIEMRHRQRKETKGKEKSRGSEKNLERFS